EINKEFVVNPLSLTIIDMVLITKIILPQDELSRIYLDYYIEDLSVNDLVDIRQELATDENYNYWE
ncbi:MAG: hypothetical protein PF447_13085, partial [Spirochaetaceae bacterium]|nr:hypothetical protein [Spirochaetaceae bacterium]